MDKSWMQLQERLAPEYQKGVKEFIDFAWDRASKGDIMLCPCVKCNNVIMRTREDMEGDLINNGMVQSYTTWRLHGEEADNVDDELKGVCDHDCNDTTEMVGDASGAPCNNRAGKGIKEHGPAEPNGEELLGDANQELYPGCEKYSKVSFLEKLHHIKKVQGMSDKSITDFLGLVKEAFPEGETLPSTFEESKKFLQDMGFDTANKDASPNVGKRKKSGCSRRR